MSKFFIIAGIIFILIGIFWPFLKMSNLGHLPGDLIFKKGNVSFYFPIVTCLIISLVLSIILWFINRK